MTSILGIETSCDETAAAIVVDGRTVRSSVVASQADLHARYGGVVPEIASRAHVELIDDVIEQALVEAGTTLDDIDAVAELVEREQSKVVLRSVEDADEERSGSHPPEECRCPEGRDPDRRFVETNEPDREVSGCIGASVRERPE